MKLYKEYGVNPFSGCWPVLLQFPILISMYSVLRWPQHPIHVPTDSALYAAVSQQIPETLPPGDPNGELITTQAQIDGLDLPGPTAGTSFLGMNLLCSAVHAGNPDATLAAKGATGENLAYPVDCGSEVVDRIPYYIFAALMFGTTFYQQRQMQKATPPGGSSQQQALLKIMPIMFGVFGIFFPAGLVLYWTTSNGWQIGQQYFMLKSTADGRAAGREREVQAAEGREEGLHVLDDGARGAAARAPRDPEAGHQEARNHQTTCVQGRDQWHHRVRPQQAGVQPEGIRVRRQRPWRRSEEAPQALRRPSRPPSASSV